ATLVGIDTVTASISGLSISANLGSDLVNPANTNPVVIDYADSATPFTVQTGGTPITFNFKNKIIQASAASVTLAISNFIFLQGSFAFTQGPTQTVTLSDNTTLAVTGFTFGGSGITAFAGIGPASSPGALGLSISNLTFGLAILEDANTTTPKHKFTTLSGTAATATLVGIDTVTASISGLSISANLGSDLVNPANTNP